LRAAFTSGSLYVMRPPSTTIPRDSSASEVDYLRLCIHFRDTDNR
jgi:hypothetical protein